MILLKEGILMTLKNWDSEKYKVNFPDISYTGEIINAPVIWKIGQITEYIMLVLRDAYKAAANGSELSGLALGVSIIDYLAGYFVGKRTTSNDYKDFIKEYFPNKYLPFIDSIYSQLRCGLLHNLVAHNPWIKNQYDYEINRSKENHLDISEQGRLIFSVTIFLEDIRRAYIEYFYNLIEKPEENEQLITNFENRFNRFNGKGSTMKYSPD